MAERHIELVWRCSACKHQNLGRHMACQSCGDPKDDSEEYEMPPDPAAVTSVTAPALLRMAQAGENWHCQYCGYGVRDLDGSCKQCGAGRKLGANARGGGAPARPQARPAPHRSRAGLFAGVIGALCAVAFFGALCYLRCTRTPPPPPDFGAPAVATAVAAPRTEFDATVIAVAWARTSSVEKWQLVAHEGFTDAVPAGAVNVTVAGQRVHHHEDVFDHDETVYDDVQVPDGFRTESYTERVQCGQDCSTTPRTCRPVCSTTPRSCRQVCTNKKNGFASCQNVCSGGNETCRDECSGGTSTCTPKYCTENRTRQIPKTRIEKRLRIVKKYRSEPRVAAWSTYKTWEWTPARKAEAKGEDVHPVWPAAGALATTNDARDASSSEPRNGDERLVQTETLSVTLRTDDGATHAYVPASATELEKLPEGSKHEVRIEGAKVTFL